MTQGVSAHVLMKEVRRLHDGKDHEAAQSVLLQILENHPEFMPAQRWRLDRMLDEGQVEAALRLARELRFDFPDMRAMATTKQATALDRLGQNGAAIRVLLELHEDGQQDIPASLLLANLLLRDGSLNRAENLFVSVRSQNPDNPGAIRGLIEIALKRGRGKDALDLCDEAKELEALPEDALALRRARGLDQLGQQTQAAEILTRQVAAGNHSTEILMALAWLEHKIGRLDAAKAHFGKVLADTPNHRPAVQGMVAILRRQGELEEAIEICTAAIEHATLASDVFHTLRADLFIALGHAEKAVSKLQEAMAQDHPRTGAFHLALGRALEKSGDLQNAHTTFLAADGEPDCYPHATLGRARILQKLGRHAEVVELLRDATQAAATPPEITLALCDAFIQTGEAAKVPPLLQSLIDEKSDLNDGQIIHILDLAERQSLPDITRHLIDHITARPGLSVGLAKRLFRLVRTAADTDALRQIAEVLCSRLPVKHQPLFQTEALALTDGPDAAIGFARAHEGSFQQVEKALLLGRLLIDSGKAALAMRYLRRVLHVHPEHPGLRSLFIHACGLARNFDKGHEYLDHFQEREPSLDLEQDRLRLLYAEKPNQSVLARAAARHDQGLPGLHPRQLLDLSLACGDLDRALTTQHAIRSDPRSTSRVAAHFTTGLQGRMLTDLQVFRSLEEKQIRNGVSPEKIKAQLAEQYYFPAKCIVDHWVAAPSNGKDPAPREIVIPKRIFQYWDKETLPEDIAALISGWQSFPRFEHVLMTRGRALALLRRQFGPRVVAAFQRARHVTEESDLLRLCLIYKFGGIYSDADDRVVGDISELAALGSGLVVTREPIGAIANNTLIAPAGNPVVRIALDMTIRSLLRRDADGAWFKSGPGMLTRAAATFLRDAAPLEARAALTIIDRDTLLRFIEPHIRLPYKTTTKYWNAQDKDLAKSVRASLLDLKTWLA